jgi:hypothetical protein
VHLVVKFSMAPRKISQRRTQADHERGRFTRRGSAFRLALALRSDKVMRTILVSSAAALAVLAFAGHPQAQVLTSSEVHRAIEHKQSADHAKLQAHFAALSTHYAADITRHKAFARSAAGPRGANAAATRHHERLAELAGESARITSELAEHHKTLAAGLPSTAPKGAEKFEAGAGAPVLPSEKRLMQLAARASKPSEHGELREYYLMLARQYEADAKEHRVMAKTYRGQNRANESAAAHCDRLAVLRADSAAEARALAREHQ